MLVKLTFEFVRFEAKEYAGQIFSSSVDDPWFPLTVPCCIVTGLPRSSAQTTQLHVKRALWKPWYLTHQIEKRKSRAVKRALQQSKYPQPSTRKGKGSGSLGARSFGSQSLAGSVGTGTGTGKLYPTLLALAPQTTFQMLVKMPDRNPIYKI